MSLSTVEQREIFAKRVLKFKEKLEKELHDVFLYQVEPYMCKIEDLVQNPATTGGEVMRLYAQLETNFSGFQETIANMEAPVIPD